MRIKFFAASLLIFFSATAQQQFLPLHDDWNRHSYKIFTEVGSSDFSSVKPLLISWLPSCNQNFADSVHEKLSRAGNFFHHLADTSLINIHRDVLWLQVDPLAEFTYGKTSDSIQKTYTNTRGVRIHGDAGSKFSFSTSFYESQAKFPLYIAGFISDSSVIPGQAHARKFKGGAAGYDYEMATGYLSYSPSKYLNMQFGQDKNFIGNGYHSLLLSDNASPYPFFKLDARVWKIRYMNLWTQFTDLHSKQNVYDSYFKKYGAFHFLDCLIGKRIELGLFEGIIWPSADSSGYRGVEFSYLNPVIFFHSVQSSLGTPDNSVMGLNFVYKLSSTAQFYSQFFLDDFDLGRSKKGKGFYRNKYAYQLGLKYFDAFKIPGLFLEAEYNEVWPYTYAHKIPTQNYTHSNQSLAHPLGANFREELFIAEFSKKRISVNLKIQVAQIGADRDSTHYGHNIFTSDYSISDFPNSYGNFVGQGIENYLFCASYEFSFLINPASNLRLAAGIDSRKMTVNTVAEKTQLIYLSLRTGMFRKSFDF